MLLGDNFYHRKITFNVIDMFCHDIILIVIDVFDMFAMSRPDSEEREMALAVKALRLNTLSKLTAEDCVKFDSLVQDMFPGVKFESNVDEQLALALRNSFTEINLIHNSQQVNGFKKYYVIMYYSIRKNKQ